MTRSELLTRLRMIRRETKFHSEAENALDRLIDDINSDGVLDVQAPADTAESMKLNIRDEAMAPRHP